MSWPEAVVTFVGIVVGGYCFVTFVKRVLS